MESVVGTNEDFRARKMKMGSRKGFTLIELLVVVAIIAVLISLLLPSLSRARESAKNVACQSNQKQIGMAMLMYANDFNDYLPAAQSPGYHVIWDGAIEPYLRAGKPMTGHRGVLACPADITPDKSVAKGSTRIYEKRSYARIAYAYYADGSMVGNPPIYANWIEKYFTITKLTNGDGAWKLALISDMQDTQNVRYVDNTMPAGWGSYFYWEEIAYQIHQGYKLPLGEFHNHGQNYVMADGHVVWLPWIIAVNGNKIIWYPNP
jgi:prepilin-type N-terminal cleavage/methylation domain-containing protein